MRDVYQEVTNTIIAALEQGVAPWNKPWGGPGGGLALPRRATGERYRGINVLMLWCAASERGYSNPTWMTFKQAIALKACVRKGEKGTLVVYANAVVKKEENAAGEETERKIPFMKGYTVFNVEQIDGLPAEFTPELLPEATRIGAADRLPEVDAFFDALGADVGHGGGQAYYRISDDRVQLPVFEAFDTAAAYYATRAHEMIHWTRHETRLNRSFGRKTWGDEGYAQEELVAELGAAFICAALGVSSMVREDHASYIHHWLEKLRQDKRYVFQAATHAQRAVDFLQELATGAGQPEVQELAEAA